MSRWQFSQQAVIRSMESHLLPKNPNNLLGHGDTLPSTLAYLSLSSLQYPIKIIAGNSSLLAAICLTQLRYNGRWLAGHWTKQRRRICACYKAAKAWSVGGRHNIGLQRHIRLNSNLRSIHPHQHPSLYALARTAAGPPIHAQVKANTISKELKRMGCASLPLSIQAADLTSDLECYCAMGMAWLPLSMPYRS